MDILFSDTDNPEAEHAAKVAVFPLTEMLSERGIGINNLGVIRKHLIDISRDAVGAFWMRQIGRPPPFALINASKFVDATNP